MAFLSQQSLVYENNQDEMSVLARALDLLREGEIHQAKAVLIARHDALICAQAPVLKQYDPQAHHV